MQRVFMADLTISYFYWFSLSLYLFLSLVPAGSPSCGRNVAVYIFDMNQLSLPTPLYSVLVSISVFMALSTVFHSTNPPDNSLLSHTVLPILFLPYWSWIINRLFVSFWQIHTSVKSVNSFPPKYNDIYHSHTVFNIMLPTYIYLSTKVYLALI